jgi:hypothetical protein
MRTNLGCIVAILFISGIAAVSLHANFPTQNPPETEDTKVAVRELEHYWGNAYIKDQMELLDQLFSPDWRNLRGHASPPNLTISVQRFKSGDDLITDCQRPQMSSAGICTGYILGVLDSYSGDAANSKASYQQCQKSSA